MVLGTISLLVTIFGGWVQATVLDTDTFANRTTTLLESPATRQRLAISLTDQIIASGPGELAGYRPVLLIAVDATLGTDAFQSIFREAVRTAHRAALDTGDDEYALNLTATLQVLSDIVATTNPDLASAIPTAPSAYLLDVTDQVRSLGFAGRSTAIENTWRSALVLTVVAYAGALAFATRRRETFTWAGAGWIVDGGLIVVATTIAPGFIADTIRDPLLATTAQELAERFLADLQSLGYWVIGYGVLLVAVANARQHLTERTTLRRAFDRAWAFATHRPTTVAGQVTKAIVLVCAGLVVVRWSGQVAMLAMATAGMVLAYFGLVELVRILGQGAPTPTPAEAPSPVEMAEVTADALASGTAPTSREPQRFWLALGGVGMFGLLVLSIGAALTVGDARARATVERSCNGSVELCDRRLDEVAFPGTHNSMAALHEPGWLFAVQTGGIPAQLEAGVRALLIDTHYGVPSTLPAPGTNRPLILTDRNASIEAGLLPAPPPTESEIPPSAEGRARDLASTAPRAPGAVPEPYLCHNWCELGATKLTDAFANVRRFVDANPNEVILLLIEDYVSADDTRVAFAEAGLSNRVWTQDLDQPLPTLQEMIDARRTLFVASQHQGPPPPWYHHGDDVITDTPFRFRSVEDLTCEHGRGDPDAPLLLANHWLDTGAPTPANGRAANTAEVLDEQIEECREERGRAPNIIAVDWYDIGSLFEVINELNGIQ